MKSFHTFHTSSSLLPLLLPLLTATLGDHLSPRQAMNLARRRILKLRR